MTPDQLRLRRLLKKNLADAATLRELVYFAHNDDASLLALINAAIFANETTITKTVGEEVTFAFENLSGTTFRVSETITGATSGATGVVVSNDSDVLVVGTLTGIFAAAEEIEGDNANTADVVAAPTTADGAVVVTYDNLAVGVFAFGETVTDNVTGATGIVVSDDGAASLILKDVTGQFNDDDAIEGATSGATADVDGTTIYVTVDLTSANGATAFVLASANDNLAIGNFSNAPTTPFKIIASGTTVFEVINGIIKTVGAVDIVLKGSTGDFANFETRSSVIKETSAVIYA